MSKKRIGIGVVGLGRIGWGHHCRRIAGSKDYELVAVADTSAERRSEAEELYGCKAYGRLGPMLDHPGLEVVVVATPTHLHRDMAIAGLKKDRHVLVEKPLAGNLADCRAILREARKHDRILTVNQSRRVAADAQLLKRVAESGKIGQLYQVKRTSHSFGRRNDWQALKKYDGGALNNNGVHALDFLLYMTGYDVKKVFCDMRVVAALGDAEDVVKIVYETRQGVVGEMELNGAAPGLGGGTTELYGTRGTAVLSGGTCRVTYFRKKDLPRKALDARLASEGRSYPRDRIDFRREEIAVDDKYAIDLYKDLAKAIRRGTSPLVKPEEAEAVLRLMDRCRKDCGRVAETRI
jgi:predicted dehydrogenase